MEVQFTVHCPDERVRHDEPFESAADAVQFAEWGHACLAGNQHSFSAFEPTVDEGWPYRFGIADRSATRIEWAVIKAFVDGWKFEPRRAINLASYGAYAEATEDA